MRSLLLIFLIFSSKVFAFEKAWDEDPNKGLSIEEILQNNLTDTTRNVFMNEKIDIKLLDKMQAEVSDEATATCKPLPAVPVKAVHSIWQVVMGGIPNVNNNGVERMKFRILYGTGFFISPKLFVTNFHVAEGSLELNKLNFFVLEHVLNNKRLHVKRLVASSAFYDVAIFEIEEEVSNYLTFKDISKEDLSFKPKRDTLVIGYPGEGFCILKTSRLGYFVFQNSPGHVSSAGGLSGSPLLDKKGKVIGVVYLVSYLTDPPIIMVTDRRDLNYLKPCIDVDFKNCLIKEIKAMMKWCQKSNLRHSLSKSHRCGVLLEEYQKTLETYQ